MKVYVIYCVDGESDTILFIDRVVNLESVAQEYVLKNNQVECGIYWDYEEKFVF